MVTGQRDLWGNMLVPGSIGKKSASPTKPAQRKRTRIGTSWALRIMGNFSNAFFALAHIIGAALMAVSDIMFFVSLAGDNPLAQWVSGGLAVVFSLGEVALWDRGISHRIRWYKGVALFLAVFTAASMVGLSIPEIIGQENTRIAKEVQDEKTIKADTLREKAAGAVITALETLPDDFGKSKTELAKDLLGLVSREETKAEQVVSSPSVVSEESSGVYILGAIGMLIFLGIRAIALQFVVLGTAPRPSKKKPIVKAKGRRK